MCYLTLTLLSLFFMHFIYIAADERTNQIEEKTTNDEDEDEVEAGDELDALVARRAGRTGAGRRGGCITLTGSR